ncbi:hypothetical protein JL720_7921 [Aureococcus anophagefferens]|nr:hypothetical protein JL720_7921 [Aureococcus anophagefferens]
MKAALLALLSTGSALRVPRRAVAGAVAGALTTPYVPLAARAADAPDALFPASIYEGTWVTERKINVQEGDAAAAAAAMKALGNTGPYEMLKKEAYEARFQPLAAPEPARGASSVSVSGDVLSFATKDGTKHALKLVDRKSEDIGRGQIGYTETYIIDGKVAAKLSRGFRPAPAPMFGGTEKSFFVLALDGVVHAGERVLLDGGIYGEVCAFAPDLRAVPNEAWEHFSASDVRALQVHSAGMVQLRRLEV